MKPHYFKKDSSYQIQSLDLPPILRKLNPYGTVFQVIAHEERHNKLSKSIIQSIHVIDNLSGIEYDIDISKIEIYWNRPTEKSKIVPFLVNKVS
jgi:hypothetical protein